MKLGDGGGLGDGDIVEHAEGAEDHRREQQASEVEVGGEGQEDP